MEWGKYYSNMYILFNMINSVNIAGREISIFKNSEEMKQEKEGKEKALSYRIPCRHIGNIGSLKAEISTFKVCENKRTLYHSSGLIYWKKLGFTPNPNQYIDYQKIREKWNKDFDKALTGQDFILDFDSHEGYQKSYKDVIKVTEFFDKYKVPYSVNFSGKKGFHIRISWNYMKEAFKEDKDKFYKKDNRYKPLVFERIYKEFALNLKDILGLKYLDTSCIFRRQPVRIPYSIHGSGYVALPLDKYQLENFNINMAKPEEVLKLNLYSHRQYKNNKGFNRNMPVFNDNFKNLKAIIKSVVL